jgi:PAS domain S-box-containing protein
MNDEEKTREQLIKEKNALEEALQELEERYQSLIETNLYGIQEIDIYGNITFMNSILYEILGYSEGSLRGMQIWDLLASDSDRNELTDYLTKIALGEYAPFPWTGTYARKGGGAIKLHVDWKCRWGTQATVTGFVSVISAVVNGELSFSHFQEDRQPETGISADLLPPPDALGAYFETEGDMMPAALPTDKILNEIHEQIAHLLNEFQSKLKYDSHKEKMIDKLHKELQEYKGDILKKYLRSIVMDIIQMIDNIRKLTHHYHTQGTSENDPEKLLKLLESIPSDLEDLFYRQGVTPFTCSGNTFDASRQRILKTLDTSDKSKDKTVAESLRPGYEWEGKVIRPEMIAVYVYK